MKRILSILLAFIIASSCAVYASALPTDDEASFDDIQWNDEMILSAGTPSLYDDDDFDPLSDEVRQEMLQKENELPDKVDLRDYDGKNYVTPVKFQNPFGSCWAFGIAAAAEISYLYDNTEDYKNLVHSTLRDTYYFDWICDCYDIDASKLYDAVTVEISIYDYNNEKDISFL